MEGTHQLAQLLGVEKVEKLEAKLRSLKTEEAETEFTELLVTIGSWPQ